MLYSIPALYCPFPIAIHPLVDEIEDHTNQWVTDFQLLDSYETFRKFRDSQFGHFIGRSFPDADFIRISAWSDLNALLFILDDQIDAQDIIKDKTSFFALMNRFIEVLEKREHCTRDKDGPVLTALSDFWRRITLVTQERWQRKFIKSIEDMFNGGYWQFEHLLLGKKPVLEEYLKVRQYFGAAHLSTDALEGIAGIDLPQYVYDDPMVHRLTELARNTICFSNDLFSFGKELEEKNNGAVFNLVLIVKDKYDLTLSEAIRKAADIHDEHIREFLALSELVYRYDEDINRTLKTYVDALGVLQRGNIEWSTLETARYPHIYEFVKMEKTDK
jgi:hypothetical protein